MDDIQRSIVKRIFDLINEQRVREVLTAIKTLDEEKFDPNIKNDHSAYLIEVAISINSIEIVEALFNKGARLDVITVEGYSLLYYPIKFRHDLMIEKLIQLGGNQIGLPIVNIADKRQRRPIHYSVILKNKNALNILLKHGAKVDVEDEKNLTPIMMGIINGSPLLNELIPLSKKLNTRNSKGETALCMASMRLDLNTISLLLHYKADVNLGDYANNHSPFFYAVAYADIPIISLLLAHNANINMIDKLGYTPLHYAADNNKIDVIKFIIQFRGLVDRESASEKLLRPMDTEKYDSNIVNIYGNTLLHILLNKCDDISLLETIIKYTNLNIQNNEGNTCLHYLTEKNMWSEFPVLKTKKLNVFIKNNRGERPIDYVSLASQNKFITLLTESYHFILKTRSDWTIPWQQECSQESILSASCAKKIKDLIEKEELSYPKKSKPVIQIKMGKDIEFSTYWGGLIDLIAGLYYLKSINKTLDFPRYELKVSRNEEFFDYYQSLGLSYDIGYDVFFLELYWVYHSLYYSHDLKKYIVDNLQLYETIIIPITISLSNGHHSNIIIINNKLNQIERFEPHGSSYPINFNYNPNVLDDSIEQLFSFLDYSYIRPEEYLPLVGLQSIDEYFSSSDQSLTDPSGYCLLWCIWYAELRSKYLDVPANTFYYQVEKKLKMSTKTFRSIIRNYSVNITEFRDSILSQTGFHVNDIISNRLTPKDYLTLAETFEHTTQYLIVDK
jgi:ankyrin repeat protein